ncbi:MAG: acyl-CoA synthetase [Rhodococcus sp. (in: high G+C Gram-positive bacteria)]
MSGSIVDTDVLGLWNIAQEFPDRVAVVDPSGRSATYGEIARDANRYGRGLQAHGLKAGDALVMILPNTVEMVAVHFAAMQIGLYVVAANWHLTGPELAYIVQDSGARVVIAHERFGKAAAIASAGSDTVPAPEFRYCVGEIDGFTSLDELGTGEPVERPDNRTLGAPMLYTSGTTGKPKGVRRPMTGADPDTVPMASIGFFSLFGIRPHDGHVHLCGSPMYHTAVLNFVTISLQLGHSVVLMDKWDPETMLALIDKHRVTHSHMVPTQFTRLLALPEDVRGKYDVSSLRAMIHGAAPCPNEIKRRMIEWWGPVVTEYYAATEGGGTVIDAEHWMQKQGSVGLPWPNSTIAIHLDDGSEAAVGEHGQVYMQMRGSSFEYYKDKAKTEAARIGDLFTLGDIGYLDEDGYLFLCDRKNDMIISGGVNIYPAEIEGELTLHPKVADVAVFGIPHTDWGEEIKAVVETVPGVTGDDDLTREILEYASERLATYKRPKTIDYIDAMPRDPNGKLYKRTLREPYWKDREKAI